MSKRVRENEFTWDTYYLDQALWTDGRVEVPTLLAAIMGSKNAVKRLKEAPGVKPVNQLRRDARLTKVVKSQPFHEDQAFWVAETYAQALTILADYVGPDHGETFEAFRAQYTPDWVEQCLQERRQAQQRQRDQEQRQQAQQAWDQLQAAVRRFPLGVLDLPSEVITALETLKREWA